ncbi:MAG: tetratricopeptide repeat protein [candidate division Zixibacteria bacterium]|nr:tetratricopeptide repeat protein [candidate division Zixibacteria bacterium]
MAQSVPEAFRHARRGKRLLEFVFASLVGLVAVYTGIMMLIDGADVSDKAIGVGLVGVAAAAVVWRYRAYMALSGKPNGHQPRDTWAALNDEVASLCRVGRYSQAIQAIEHAMNQADLSDTDRAGYLSLIGSVHDVQGEYDRAEQYYRRALEIEEQLYGPNHPEMLSTLGNLAELCRATGRLTEAKAIEQRIQSISGRP